MVFNFSLINIWSKMRKVIKFISFTVSYNKRFYENSIQLNHVDDVVDEFLKYIKNNPLKHRRLRDHLKDSEESNQ